MQTYICDFCGKNKANHRYIVHKVFIHQLPSKGRKLDICVNCHQILIEKMKEGIKNE